MDAAGIIRTLMLLRGCEDVDKAGHNQRLFNTILDSSQVHFKRRHQWRAKQKWGSLLVSIQWVDEWPLRYFRCCWHGLWYLSCWGKSPQCKIQPFVVACLVDFLRIFFNKTTWIERSWVRILAQARVFYLMKFPLKKMPSNSSQQYIKEPGVRPKKWIGKDDKQIATKSFFSISLEVCQDKVWAETKLVKLEILEQQRFVFILINIFSLIKKLWFHSLNCKKDLSVHCTTFVLSQNIDAVSVAPSTSAN